jgi:hypothetical protein
MKTYRTIALLVLMCVPFFSRADGVSLYLPVNVSPRVEADIERLVVLANIADLTKPYAIAAIERGLPDIAVTHPALHRRIASYLTHYAKKAAVTHGAAELAYASAQNETPVAQVNRRGSTTADNATVSFRSHYTGADWLALSIGGEISDEIQQATGTLLSLGVSWAQLDIGYKEYWLSPFLGSAQLLSTQAQTLPAVSLSNHLPIQFLGAGFNYEFFVAQLSKQLTAFQGSFSDEKAPLLASAHFSLQPVPWWILGATRNFQFGGGERETTLSTLVRAFYDPRGADNDAGVDEESGNQIASISSKIIFDGKLPFAFNVELAGEDTSNNKSYQLGNPALTAGVYFPIFFSENVSFTYEYSDWDSGWYQNNVYQEGYSNEGFVLGHWGLQDQFDNGTAAPGTGHFLTAQWLTPWRDSIQLSLRTVDHKAPIYEPAWNFELDYSHPLKHMAIAMGAFAGENSLGNSFFQIRVGVQWR